MYYRLRYLKTATRRFINQDPISSINSSLYSYVDNLPTMYVDPFGKFGILIILYTKVKNVFGNNLNTIQTGLDAAGVFDPTPITDGTNAGIHLLRGNYGDAAGSAVSIVPIVGDAIGKGGKLGFFLMGSKKVCENQKATRRASKTWRNMWEKAERKKWPTEPSGRNYDVSHKKALADGGADKLDNIEPKPHKKHMDEHKEKGDFSRCAKEWWEKHKGK